LYSASSEADEESIIGKVSDFLERNPWTYILFLLACFALFLSTFFAAGPTAPEGSARIYDFNYGPVLVYKSVAEASGQHAEKIVVSSKAGAKMLSLFVLVPKSLAQSAADFSLSSNGRISVLKGDPLYRIDAINNDSISAEFSVPTEKKSCSLLVVMHAAVVSAMTKAQLQETIEAIAAKELPGMDCEKANSIEKDLGERIYAAATLG